MAPLRTFLRDPTLRFFFFLGNTADDFCLPDLSVVSCQRALHAHLLALGYRRVVLFHGQRGVSFLDPGSRRLMPAPPGPTLEDFRAVLRASPQPPPPPPGAIAAEAIEQIDRCMLDESCPTAVLFTDALDFFTHTEPASVRALSGRFVGWQRLSGACRNVCLFLFPPVPVAEIERLLRQRGGWEFFRGQIFSNPDRGKLSEQVFVVGAPGPDEVGWLLHHHRLRRSLPTDWSALRDAPRRLCRLPPERSGRLKRLHGDLTGLASLRAPELARLWGEQQQKPAIERLRAMLGVGSVPQRIEALIRLKQDEVRGQAAQIEGDPPLPERLLPPLPRPETPLSLHLILRGRPGTGKTTVAMMIGDIFRDSGLLPVGHTVKVTRADLVAGYVGQTALKTTEKITEALGGVLFIDEAYTLAEGGPTDFGKEAIDTLLEAMSARNGQFSVVLAGYPGRMDDFLRVNPGLSRRFGKWNILTIDDYTPDLLRQIFEQHVAREGRSLDGALRSALPAFFDAWFAARDPENFGNAGDVMNLYQEMNARRLMRADPRASFCLDDLPPEMRHLAEG